MKLLCISVCCHLAGAAGVAAVMNWPNAESMVSSVLFSPLLALAGWPMGFLILLLVLIMWGIDQQEVFRPKWAFFFLVGAAVGAGIGAMFKIGPEPKWRLAFMVGGCLAGTVSNLLLVLSKNMVPNDNASPNGGPVAPADRSEITNEPPSVS